MADTESSDPLPGARRPATRRDKLFGAAVGLGLAIVALVGMALYHFLVLVPAAQP